MKLLNRCCASAMLVAAAMSCPVVLAAGPALGTWGFDTTGMDRSVKPGDDFHRYANGAWIQRTTIPDDRSKVTVFSDLDDRVQGQLLALLTEMAADRAAPPGSNRQILGDWFASYNDEKAIEAAGTAPLQASLSHINAIRTRSDLARYLSISDGLPGGSPIKVSIQTDAKDSAHYIAQVDLLSEGLSLGERDAYQDPKSDPRRRAYRLHVERMLALAGLKDAKRRAQRVLDLETRIAAALLPSDKVDYSSYNMILFGEMGKRFPGVDWAAFFSASGLSEQSSVFVQTPPALAAGARLVAGVPLETWRDYLTYQYINGCAEVLPLAFREEHFDFYTRSLGLQKTMRPRQAESIDTAKEKLQRFLGEEYVRLYVSQQTKAAAIAMVDEIKAAFDDRLARLDWISDSTRTEARRKLAATLGQISHPDHWPATEPLKVVRGDALGNHERVIARSARIYRAKLGTTSDRKAWDLEHMAPYWAGATVDPTKPAIIITAGILQAPFFDAAADPAANYGGLGAVIAHEFTHLFDHLGSHFDAEGNVRDWFAPEDAEKFKARGERLAGQMSRYEAMPGMFVDGKRTLHESQADLGGVHIAFDAYRRSLKGKPAPIIDGTTGDQRFFLAWAQNWRGKLKEERLKQDTLGGSTYATLQARAAMVRNIDAWYEAFDVKPGEKLYLKPEDRLTIW
jgi:putative endopeptidase